MLKRPLRMSAAAALTAALLAGCGGGGGDAPAAPGIGQNVSALVSFIGALIADSSETSEPIDIDPLTLAVDDGAEPSPL